MNDILGLGISAKILFELAVSIGFFVGIILMVSPEAFTKLDQALQKEYGIKKRFIPKLEDTAFHHIDRAIVKNRIIAGLCIAVSSFLLLLIYRV